jgi:hypothetical protein
MPLICWCVKEACKFEACNTDGCPYANHLRLMPYAYFVFLLAVGIYRSLVLFPRMESYGDSSDVSNVRRRQRRPPLTFEQKGQIELNQYETHKKQSLRQFKLQSVVVFIWVTGNILMLTNIIPIIALGSYFDTFTIWLWPGLLILLWRSVKSAGRGELYHTSTSDDNNTGAGADLLSGMI